MRHATAARERLAACPTSRRTHLRACGERWSPNRVQLAASRRVWGALGHALTVDASVSATRARDADFLADVWLRPAFVSGTSTQAARVPTSVGHAGSPYEVGFGRQHAEADRPSGRLGPHRRILLASTRSTAPADGGGGVTGRPLRRTARGRTQRAASVARWPAMGTWERRFGVVNG